MRVEIKDRTDAVTFMLAGNATVTIKSKKTGNHFTYRIKRSDDGKVIFVSVLSGADNTSDYTYIGLLSDKGLTHTKGSKCSKDAPSFKAFHWFWMNLYSDLVEVYHEGRCGRCGRKLTTPESIECGLGPICREK